MWKLLNLLYYHLTEIIFAYLLGDFLMGIYHWIKDTYFSPHTPIIGKSFIWGSRLHHIRPRYVCEFSDIYLFTNSFIWTLSWVGPLLLWFGPNLFLISLLIIISLNDVIHKYAHLMDFERPILIKFLQKILLLQTYDEHHLHHLDPHDMNYCPITPYLNIFLEGIYFWKKMEYFIEYFFGIKPRMEIDEYIEDSNYPAGIKFIQT